MKNKFISFVLLMCVSLCLPVTSHAVSGKGTATNPFRITNEEELLLLSDFPECYFELANDIEITGVWEPIEDFSGSFNGNNHTISVSEYKAKSNTGFIGILSGTISNLTLDAQNLNFSRKNNMGIIAGECNGVVYNCIVKGTATFESGYQDYYAGGICGTLNGKILNCKTMMDLTLKSIATSGSKYQTDYYNLYIGGICGISNGKIIQCINTSNITFYTESISYNVGGMDPGTVKGVARIYYGGISSNNAANASITNSYNLEKSSTFSRQKSIDVLCYGGISADNTGNIMNCYSVGGEIDANYKYGISKGGTITSSFYDKTVINDSSESYGNPKSTIAMKMEATYRDWDFKNIWAIDESETPINNGFPYLLCEYSTDSNLLIFDYKEQKANVYVKEKCACVVIFVEYNGEKISSVDIQPFDLNQGYNSIPTSLVLKDGDKVFLWKNLTTMTPMCKAAEVSSK